MSGGHSDRGHNALGEGQGIIFIPNNLIHGYSTRKENMLHLHSISSTYGRRAIQFKGGILWNSIPFSLQSQMSLRTFKIKIKQYLSSVSFR